MMNNLESYFPKPNNWFATKLKYVGRGEAEFVNPKGSVFGRTVIEIKETGDCEIRLQIESYMPENMSHELDEILFGLPAYMGAGKIWTSSMENTCTKLEVKTKIGIFYTDKDIRYAKSSENELTFHVSLAHFTARTHNDAKYWVLPLANFLSEFVDGHRILDGHPLCIRRIPEFPEGLLANLNMRARIYEHNARQNKIVFEFDGKPAFIEPLSDYGKRAEKLQDGKARNLLTAVMVGETNGRSLEVDAIEDWFPFQLLDLLSFASGSRVEAPWIEFRDEAGKLVRRLHYLPRRICFEAGYTVIDEVRDQGTGRLLTQAQQSEYYDNKTLHVVTEIAALLSRESLTIDDRLAYIIRGLDTLCHDWDFYETYRPKKILSEEKQKIIAKILEDASKAIRDIEGQIDNKESVEAEVLRRIAQKIQESDGSIRVGFWQALLRLLDEYEIRDAKVLEKHFQTKRVWTRWVKERRGMVIHHSYLRQEETQEKDHVLEQFKFTRHLHDVLIRILLKMWNYDGTYQATSSKWVESKSLDWVTEDTPARDLGYE